MTNENMTEQELIEKNPDLKKIIEKEEKKTRELSGFWQYLISGLGIFMVFFYLYSSGIKPVSVELHRGIYVLLTYVIIFLLYPFHAHDSGIVNSVIIKIPAAIRVWLFNRYRPGLFDLLLTAIAIFTVGYWMVEYENLNYRAGAYNDLDFIVSVVGIIIGLEISRRLLGWSMTLVGLGFLFYALFGDYFPGAASHRGFSLEKTMTYIFFEQDGVFGVMADVLSTYVILFIFFGAFLAKSGASRFFIDFPMALAGRTTGGPAKVAVMASALFGSISGSAIANTVTTGTFTIPLMKKAGFKPHQAGAIEPAASIGGMFMPPVMGAGGFLMAELTEIPYSDIMIMSFFPAFLYFLSVFVAIHFEAKKLGLGGMSESEMQRPWDVFKKQWYLSSPIIIITVLMLIGYSASFSAFWATLSTIVISWFDKDYRMGPKEILQAMINGSKATLVIGATVGVIGIVIGSIALTGIGLKFSNLIISLSNGNLVIAIFLVALASLILGMGVPVTAAYLITAVLSVGALEEMGVVLIAAHQINYWFSQDSNITPPVAVAAYAGAAIAGADPWKTGWTSFKYAKMLYVMPFLFAFTPQILLQTAYTVDLGTEFISPMASIIHPQATLEEVLLSFFTATLGTIMFGSVTQLYLLRRTTWYEWIMVSGATFLTYIPVFPYFVVGLGLYGFVYLIQKISVKNQMKKKV